MMLGTSMKSALGVKAARSLAKNPGPLRRVAPAATKAGLRLVKPLAKRRARRRADRIGDVARGLVTVIASYAPQAARAFGIVEQPKPKPIAPWVGTGIVLGATAIYFLEPGQGRARREQVVRLVS